MCFHVHYRCLLTDEDGIAQVWGNGKEKDEDCDRGTIGKTVFENWYYLDIEG